MTKLYQKYISFLYLKNFFIIFTALETFYVGIDLLVNLKNFPSSANLQLLYVFFTAQSAIGYTLPLSLIFAMIVSKISMIRSNELISLYSSAISKKQVIMPIFVISLIITIAFIMLNFTNFAYSHQNRSNILNFGRVKTDITKLFLKYNDKYIFFNNYSPIKNEADGIKIFEIFHDKIGLILDAKKATFSNDKWQFQDFNASKFLNETSLNKKIIIRENNFTNPLDGFKPSLIESVYSSQQQNTLSVVDAFETLIFLRSQNLSTTNARATIYSLVFMPLYAPFMVMILFFYIPTIGRFFNLALLGFILLFVALCVWGLIFLLNQFAISGTLMPEFAILLPVCLMIYAMIKFVKTDSEKQN